MRLSRLLDVPTRAIAAQVMLRWRGGGTHEVTAPFRMIGEPHRLVLEVGAGAVLVQQCRCAACASQPDAEPELSPPSIAELALYLAHIATADGPPTELDIVLDDAMLAPLADGSTTRAVRFARALRTAVRDQGLACRLMVPALHARLEELERDAPPRPPPARA